MYRQHKNPPEDERIDKKAWYYMATCYNTDEP
jgi:hypothetical protein